MKRRKKMNTSKFTKVICMALAVFMLVGCMFSVVACKQPDNTKYYDNETDKLVFATQEVDKVFNPFFSTSAMDSNVVGMTQLGILTNDAAGNPVCGENEATIAKDYQVYTNDLPKDNGQQTTYSFVLKNNVLFSNGSPLTIKDVLFNLYVYLDPVYTGSSTIYSTDIVGLQEYRTQTEDEDEQDAFDTKYRVNARARIDSLIEAAADILKNHSEEFVTVEKMEQYLAEEWSAISAYKNVVADFAKAQELFLQELNDDYSISIYSYEDQIFTDKNGNIHKNLLKSDVEMFLLNEGFITWDKNGNNGQGELLYTLGKEVVDAWTNMDKNEAKTLAIQTVYDSKMPADIEEILSYWQTSNNLFDYIVAAEMEADRPDGALKYPNIKGIQFANRTESVEVNGNTYAVPEYETIVDDNGKEWKKVKDGYNEVLTITIKNIDPKAIWNFSFGVAPMYYYSDEEHIAKFDFESNFGVEYKSQTFMDEVVKKNIGVPVGAGPYAASKASGGIDASKITAGDFYDKGVIYFERNPHFVAGAPKIKYVRYQVVPSNGMLNSLYTGQVDYAEPNAKQETEQELKEKASEGIGYKAIKTLGYGYIGINAGKIPSVYVRRAIMYAIDTSMTVTYYKTMAEPIYRSMSRESWAYPKDAVSYYPYIGGTIPQNVESLYQNNQIDADYYEFVTLLGKKGGESFNDDEQVQFIRWLLEEKAGYKLNANGLYAQNGKNECKFEFTIAGQETDHPAYRAMVNAGNLLDKAGFSINVRTDKDALKKLNNGALTVWAAAWGATIDPDMYQVYHKDSKATSVTNWGYKQILASSNSYEFEKRKIDELSELIEEARSIDDQKNRAQLYSDALDIVMELAIELPTYQRKDMFAYNALKLDTTTFNQQLSAFKGLTSDIHLVSLVVEK